jgi:hypothetical protein
MGDHYLATAMQHWLTKMTATAGQRVGRGSTVVWSRWSTIISDRFRSRGDDKDDVSPEPVIFDEGALKLAQEHLKFHHDRIAAGSDVVTTIGQYIFILFGAGAIAATQIPPVFVVVPLFWSAWLLHSMQRTRDSIKHEVFARQLEISINHSLQQPVLLWNVALTGGSSKVKTPVVSVLNYGYWITLNLSSWVIAVVLLFRTEYRVWAYPVIGLGIVVYAGVIEWLCTNGRFKKSCEKAVREQIRLATAVGPT